jgi:hypothetical protein
MRDTLVYMRRLMKRVRAVLTLLSLCFLLVAISTWIFSYSLQSNVLRKGYLGRPGDRCFLAVMEGRWIFVCSESVLPAQREAWNANPLDVTAYNRESRRMPLWYTVRDPCKPPRFAPTHFIVLPCWFVVGLMALLPTIWVVRHLSARRHFYGGRGFEPLTSRT